MTDANRGWFNQPKEHSLAAKGIPTKNNNPRTYTRVPETTQSTKSHNSNTLLDKETDRLIQLFADQNYKYELSPSYNNNGIYLSEGEATKVMRIATPNGCGRFETSNIKQMSEAYQRDARFLIRRDLDGGVMILVNGTPNIHPGSIREWVNASLATIDDDDVVTYKWSPDKSAKVKPEKTRSTYVDTSKIKTDKALLEWAEEIKTGQTDISFADWVKEGEH